MTPRILFVLLLSAGFAAAQIIPPGGDTLTIDVDPLVTNGGALVNGQPVSNGTSISVTAALPDGAIVSTNQ
jgi:hypothetical protein